jgi:hypothetical protein
LGAQERVEGAVGQHAAHAHEHAGAERDDVARARPARGDGPLDPTDIEVARLLAAVRGRIIRLLRRHDIDLESSLDAERSDPLTLDSPGGG